MDPRYKTYYVFLRVWKTEVVLNGFIFNRILTPTVWCYWSVKFSGTTCAHVWAFFTSRMDAFIVHLGLISNLLNPSLRNSKIGKAPITVTCGIKLSVLIRAHYFQKARVLFKTISDLFWHWLIKANFSISRRKWEYFSECGLVLLTIIREFTYQSPSKFSDS